jgi:hypothetical protein
VALRHGRFDLGQLGPRCGLSAIKWEDHGRALGPRWRRLGH